MIDGNCQRRVRSYATQFLEQGRVDWDLPHTESVVFYALLLANQENIDDLTMFTAAWFHDIGYYGLFDESTSSRDWGTIADRKKLHMIRGAEYAEAFLLDPQNSPYYSEGQAERIEHLISVHDKVEQLEEPDEVALGVADTLGAIDVTRVTPTFDYAGYQKYCASGLKRRGRLFRTEFTRKLYNELLPLFVSFFEDKQK